MINFEELSDRGKFCVDKYEKFVSSFNKDNVLYIHQSNRENMEVGYYYWRLENDEEWYPHKIYYGSMDELKTLIQKKEIYRESFFNSFSIQVMKSMPLSFEYFICLGMEYYGEYWNYFQDEDIKKAFEFVRSKKYFCPSIKNPHIIVEDKFAFDMNCLKD